MSLTDLAVLSVFIVTSVWLSVEDIRHQSVRNIDLVLGAGALTAAVWWKSLGEGGSALLPLISATVYFIVYLVLGVLSRGNLGSGDYWGAGLLGMFLGSWAPESLAVGWAMPFAVAFLPALGARRSGKRYFAFLPYIFGSSVISVTLSLL